MGSIDKSSKGTMLRSMAIFTAIELCGSILNGKTGVRTTKENFISFCNSDYMPPTYNEVSDLLYTIFRCGVAHSYISKGAALLSSNYNDKNKHLVFYQNGLFIYVPEFSKDVSKAIRSLYKDIKTNSGLEANYKKVINQLDGDGLRSYQDFIRKNGMITKKFKINRDIVTDLV